MNSTHKLKLTNQFFAVWCWIPGESFSFFWRDRLWSAALTRNDLALNHFLSFWRARRRIDWSRLFRSCAKSRFHLARQFQPQGFEDCRPLRGHWVGWITNHFAGNMAAPVIQFLQQDAP